jgi:hypothetical protein
MSCDDMLVVLEPMSVVCCEPVGANKTVLGVTDNSAPVAQSVSEKQHPESVATNATVAA